jgi:hypothetical protein
MPYPQGWRASWPRFDEAAEIIAHAAVRRYQARLAKPAQARAETA